MIKKIKKKIFFSGWGTWRSRSFSSFATIELDLGWLPLMKRQDTQATRYIIDFLDRLLATLEVESLLRLVAPVSPWIH